MQIIAFEAESRIGKNLDAEVEISSRKTVAAESALTGESDPLPGPDTTWDFDPQGAAATRGRVGQGDLALAPACRLFQSEAQ